MRLMHLHVFSLGFGLLAISFQASASEQPSMGSRLMEKAATTTQQIKESPAVQQLKQGAINTAAGATIGAGVGAVTVWALCDNGHRDCPKGGAAIVGGLAGAAIGSQLGTGSDSTKTGTISPREEDPNLVFTGGPLPAPETTPPPGIIPISTTPAGPGGGDTSSPPPVTGATEPTIPVITDGPAPGPTLTPVIPGPETTTGPVTIPPALGNGAGTGCMSEEQLQAKLDELLKNSAGLSAIRLEEEAVLLKQVPSCSGKTLAMLEAERAADSDEAPLPPWQDEAPKAAIATPVTPVAPEKPQITAPAAPKTPERASWETPDTNVNARTIKPTGAPLAGSVTSPKPSVPPPASKSEPGSLSDFIRE